MSLVTEISKFWETVPFPNFTYVYFMAALHISPSHISHGYQVLQISLTPLNSPLLSWIFSFSPQWYHFLATFSFALPRSTPSFSWDMIIKGNDHYPSICFSLTSSCLLHRIFCFRSFYSSNNSTHSLVFTLTTLFRITPKSFHILKFRLPNSGLKIWKKGVKKGKKDKGRIIVTVEANICWPLPLAKFTWYALSYLICTVL